jgi:hypothetical protein
LRAPLTEKLLGSEGLFFTYFFFLSASSAASSAATPIPKSTASMVPIIIVHEAKNAAPGMKINWIAPEKMNISAGTPANLFKNMPNVLMNEAPNNC